MFFSIFKKKKSKTSSSSSSSTKPATTATPVATPAPTTTTVVSTPVASIPQTQSSASVTSTGSDVKRQQQFYSTLLEKDIRQWTPDEVSAWLEYIELGEYSSQFVSNAIAGIDLVDLQDEDLISINIKKLGHRKKIISKIRQLANKGNPNASSGAGSSKVDDDAASTHSSESHTSSSVSVGAQYVLKCSYNNDVTPIKISQDTSLASLKKKIKKEFGFLLDIKYIDKDGDLIPISKDEHLQTVLKSTPNKTLKIQLTEPKVDLGAQTSVLDNLVDTVVIIDPRGTIIYVNKAFESLFGYQKKDVVSKNVSTLMPKDIAEKHDGFLKRYLQTGDGKIIGVGRNVTALKKDGSTFTAFLTLSETRNSKQHTFTGLVRESADAPKAENKGLDAKTQYAILDNILDAAIVIDTKGIVQCFNRRACNMFGYTTTEAIGRNVKMLMPSQYADNHDNYIKQYVDTGIAKVINIGRDVVAQKKDGSFFPVNLSVTENQFSDGRKLFTGILRELEEEESKTEKSVLQQEREVIENLVVAAVIINEKGMILAFNAAIQELLGYKLPEVINKNVKMLMTPSDAAHHDAYLATYTRTNKARVLGTGRDVVCQHKNGQLVRVRLSVTERIDCERRIFTGVLQKI